MSKNLETKICRTIILPVLCGCDTWSCTLRDEHRLRVFENRLPVKIFESKREEEAGSQRRSHNEELHNLYNSPNIVRVIKSKRMRWAGHIACMGKMICVRYFDQKARREVTTQKM
jgi:hypothetical protein